MNKGYVDEGHELFSRKRLEERSKSALLRLAYKEGAQLFCQKGMSQTITDSSIDTPGKDW